MYTEPEWAFGSIHYELTKHLFAHGINATVLNWERSYNQQEITELAGNTDYFHSSPYGVNLLITNYGIAPEQCIATVHAKWDLNHLIEYGADMVNRLHGYTAVSEWLVEQSAQAGIARVPTVTPVAINYDTFHHAPAQRLQTVGFAVPPQVYICKSNVHGWWNKLCEMPAWNSSWHMAITTVM